MFDDERRMSGRCRPLIRSSAPASSSSISKEVRMPWWEIIGWTGSALVVISLVVPSIRKFRTLNLLGSLIATIYNVVFGIWPYAAMNAVIAIIDAYWLIRLRGGGAREYRVVPVDAASGPVADFVARHGDGIRGAFPAFRASDLEDSNATAFLTMSGDEVAGLFAQVADGADGRILVDFVTERHRDLKPGSVLYADEKVRACAPSRLVVEVGAVSDPDYFRRMGFRDESGRLALSLHD